MRFNKERAQAMAEYAIYSILEYAREKELYCVQVSKPAIVAALGQVNLYGDHSDFIAKHASNFGIAMGEMAGNFYFFIPNHIDVLDASAALKPATDEYARLSKEGRDELYNSGDIEKTIKNALASAKKASGKRAA